LADARTAHQNARELLKNGIDPSHNKRLEKLTRNIAASDTFKAIAEEWFIQKQGESSKRNQSRTLAILEKDLFPYIGDIAISQIKPLEILTAIRKIEQRGSTTYLNAQGKSLGKYLDMQLSLTGHKLTQAEIW